MTPTSLLSYGPARTGRSLSPNTTPHSSQDIPVEHTGTVAVQRLYLLASVGLDRLAVPLP
jgi:hypothetical protein